MNEQFTNDLSRLKAGLPIIDLPADLDQLDNDGCGAAPATEARRPDQLLVGSHRRDSRE